PLAETFRTVIRETLGGLYSRDPERLLTRVRLALTGPEVRARFLNEQIHGIEQLTELGRPLNTKRGPPVDDLTLGVLGSAILATVTVALDAWQRDGGKTDLLALLDQATAPLAPDACDVR